MVISKRYNQLMPISLQQALLPGIKTYVSQADYMKKNGHPPPPYDPNLPDKLWEDPREAIDVPFQNVFYPNNNPWRGFTYNIVVLEKVFQNGTVVEGVAVLEPTFIPEFIAARVNIPGDQSGDKNVSTAVNQFPIRDLLPGESVHNSPFGIWIDQG